MSEDAKISILFVSLILLLLFIGGAGLALGRKSGTISANNEIINFIHTCKEDGGTTEGCYKAWTEDWKGGK